MSLTYTVEVAFQADPYAASPTWTDVTSRVERFSCARGRNFELGQAEAGTLSLSLDNSDGYLDPTNAASPYYPYVLPFRPVRIKAVYNAVTYDVWRGFVTSWPQTWSANGDRGMVTVTGVDGMKAVLAKLFGPQYSAEVLADSPAGYLRLNEATSSATNLADSVGTFPFVSGGTTHTSASGLVTGSPDTASSVAAPMTTTVNVGKFSGSIPQALAADWTVEVIAKPVTVPTDSTFADILIANTGAAGPSGTDRAYIRMQFGATAAAARYQVQLYDSSSAANVTVTISSAVVPTAGRADHIAITRSGTAVTVYINGTSVGTATLTAGNGVGFPNPVYLAHTRTTVSPFTMVLDELAIYASALSSARISRHYTTARVNPQEFPSQLTSARVTAILDAVAWPSAQRTIATGLSTVAASGSLDGTSALTALQTAADDELGNVFIDGAGKVVFQARGTRNSPTSVATFGDGGANLLTVNQSSLETNTTGWAGSGGTLSRSTAWAADGVASLALTATGTADMFIRTPTGTSGVPVTANQTYTAVATTRAATVARSFLVRLDWYTAAGASISSSTGTAATNATTGTGTQAFVTGTAPGTAAFVSVVVYVGAPGGAGEIHYIDKVGLSVGRSTDWTLGADTAETPYLGDLQIGYDDTYIYNDIQVTQNGSSPTFIGEVLDATSQTSYGLRVLQRSTNLTSTTDINGQAATLLAWYKDPHPRVPQVSMEGVSTPTSLPQMLGRAIGDLVTVKRRPPAATAISIDCFIDGVSHDVQGVNSWQTTFMLTPKFANTTY